MERIFGLGFVLISVVVLNYVFIEQNYFLLGPINYLEISILQNIGAIVGIAGLVFSFIAQMQMGDSWRLGISTAEKTTLVTRKLYRFSRNPIYIGLIFSYIEFFFLMPSAVSILVCALNIVAIQMKVYLEEDYLLHRHGELFSQYKQSVRRWL